MCGLRSRNRVYWPLESMSAWIFLAEGICSTLIAKENTICYWYKSLIISFASGFDA